MGRRSPFKKLLISLLCIFLALLLIVVTYLLYVICSYSRIEDNLSLAVENPLSRKAKTGETYTIVTQNIGFGAYTADFTFFMDGGTESRAESAESVVTCVKAATEQIAAQNPDLILVQEVDTDSTRSYHIDQRIIFREKFPALTGVFAQNYHSAYLMYPFTEPHGKSNSGMLTLSDLKITSSVRRSLPISTSFSKFLDLDRCYSVSRIPVENGKELVVYNVHLSAYGADDNISASQMSMLLSDMKSEYDKGNYAIAGGDFNNDFTTTSVPDLNDGKGHEELSSWAQPFPVSLLPEGISRAMDYTGGKLAPTCRNCDVPYEEGNFSLIVDGFLYSANVNVSYLENIRTGFVYSDHNPVVMQFSLV